MVKKWKMFLSIGALVVLTGLALLFVIGGSKDNKTSLKNDGSGDVAGAVSNQGGNYIERLTRHLSDSGMVLYGSNQSLETKQQQDLFGSAAANIDYVDCDAATNSSNSDECVGQNITIYPTWVYKGDKYENVQMLSELAKITDFEQ